VDVFSILCELKQKKQCIIWNVYDFDVVP